MSGFLLTSCAVPPPSCISAPSLWIVILLFVAPSQRSIAHAFKLPGRLSSFGWSASHCAAPSLFSGLCQHRKSWTWRYASWPTAYSWFTDQSSHFLSRSWLWSSRTGGRRTFWTKRPERLAKLTVAGTRLMLRWEIWAHIAHPFSPRLWYVINNAWIPTATMSTSAARPIYTKS